MEDFSGNFRATASYSSVNCLLYSQYMRTRGQRRWGKESKEWGQARVERAFINKGGDPNICIQRVIA